MKIALDTLIEIYSGFGLPPNEINLFLNQIRAESSFEKYALNTKSLCFGLAQFQLPTFVEWYEKVYRVKLSPKLVSDFKRALLQGTYKRERFEVFFDPEVQLRLQTEYMRYLLAKYNNNWELALAGYNWGPGNVDKLLKKGYSKSKLPKETQNYIDKILNAEVA